MADLIVTRPRITPFLWYEKDALDAARLYTSIFPNSRIESDDDGDDPLRSDARSVSFWLDGQRFIAFNGGPHFTFTAAISFFVHCESQTEVDYYWSALVEGGEASRCGWLQDRFGLSWQIVPGVLADLLGAADRAAAERTMNAMLDMQKLDIAELQRASRGNAEPP